MHALHSPGRQGWSAIEAASEAVCGYRYDERSTEVAAFNAAHSWKKRGISITPCRFDCGPVAQIAAVSIQFDGSVLVTSGGLEVGQGLATKVKQVVYQYQLPQDAMPVADVLGICGPVA